MAPLCRLNRCLHRRRRFGIRLGCGGSQLRIDHHAGSHSLQTADDDAISFVHSFENHALRAFLLANSTVRYSILFCGSTT